MNSASRLLSIVQFFNSADRNAAIQTLWEKYLGPSPTPLSEEDVLTAVQAMLAEIRIMEAKLKSIGAPEQLYSDCVNRLRSSFSPTQLNVPWVNHREPIERQATSLALQWAEWALSISDEDEIDDAAMQELRANLESQEQLLKDTELPAGLREMLERQTASLRRALQLYRIGGVEPVRKVVSDSYGELATASEELVQEVASSPSNVQEVFQKGKRLIGNAAEIADKGSKVIKFGKEVYDLGKAGWQIGQELLRLTQ